MHTNIKITMNETNLRLFLIINQNNALLLIRVYYALWLFSESRCTNENHKITIIFPLIIHK